MELDMSADDYDEEAMIAELAAYYGVDPSLISLEAEPITERRRLADAGASAGSGRMRLKVTIVVPEEVEEAVEGSLTTESSLTQAGSEGGGGGESGGPTVKKVAVTAESFAGRLAQLNSGGGGLLSLSAALGVNTTVAGERADRHGHAAGAGRLPEGLLVQRGQQDRVRRQHLPAVREPGRCGRVPALPRVLRVARRLDGRVGMQVCLRLL